MSEHLSPALNKGIIKVFTYYKPYKLASQFSTRTASLPRNRSHVVYQFSCSEDRCNATCVGYTTNPLLTRCKQHRFAFNSIYTHYTIDHSMIRPPANELINHFSILYSNPDKLSLKIAESITIKSTNPLTNVKYN